MLQNTNHYRDFPDARLLDLLKINDKKAFIEIYDRYWPKLVLHANRMLHDEELAKDITQEIFTKLFQHSSNIAINISLSSYLYSAIRYKVLDCIKHDKVKINYADDFLNYAQNSGELADEQYNLKELAAIIESEIEKLPTKMREIFDLSRKEYYSQREIAKILNISESTVNNQIQRALQKLRRNNALSKAQLVLSYLAIIAGK